jgi:hypothetical protein
MRTAVALYATGGVAAFSIASVSVALFFDGFGD